MVIRKRSRKRSRSRNKRGAGSMFDRFKKVAENRSHGSKKYSNKPLKKKKRDHTTHVCGCERSFVSS